jgi:predicted lipoprotein with Yx(FWY)xxD motif
MAMQRRRMAAIRRGAGAALALPLLAAAGCGGSSTVQRLESTPASPGVPTASVGPGTTAHSVRISSTRVGGLGTVLVDGQGRTLYAMTPENPRLACTGTCLWVWRPLTLTGEQRPVAGGQVDPRLLGSAPGPGGVRVVTYAGHRLHTYSEDAVPGTTGGEGLNISGGLWTTLAPSGEPN